MQDVHCNEHPSSSVHFSVFSANFSFLPLCVALSVSPSPSAPVRVCPPLVSPEDWPSVGTVGGVLSYIQLTTRRAYEHVLDMLDDSHRR